MGGWRKGKDLVRTDHERFGPIGRERDTVALDEAISQHPDETRAFVEAVDMLRKSGRRTEALHVPRLEGIRKRIKQRGL
jgi:hypothetical protein